jgi:serine protease Do/serine protease DegQ
MIALALMFLLAASPDPKELLRAMEDAFAAVAEQVTPAVVHISTTPKRGAGVEREPEERFREFFGPELYERFFRRRPREENRAAGSGVVVDPRGYILTNNHVIENAQDITVRLSDARKFTAKLVGRDPKTDLAVLKIDAPAALPVAELGDSDRLRIGQWAIAIGNPFGLDRTVTVGIISATARTRVGLATYESFIQTDASINPGNSGGPLLNLDGKVIGINTAIVASGQGIGFAIPANMARDVMRQLITKGRVVRGWLGIVIQDVTDELSPSFGVREREGVLVADVMTGSPADAGGVRQGDVIVEFGGDRIKEVPELQRRVASVSPGQSIAITVVRERRPVGLRITVGEMPADEPMVTDDTSEETLGLAVEPVPSELAQRLDPPAAAGVVVTSVAPGGPADRAGLRPGDVILELDRQIIVDVAGFRKVVGALAPGQTVPLYVHRVGNPGGRQYLALETPAR